MPMTYDVFGHTYTLLPFVVLAARPGALPLEQHAVQDKAGDGEVDD